MKILNHQYQLEVWGCGFLKGWFCLQFVCVGVVKSASANSLDRDEEEDVGGVVQNQDLPRVDISNQITEALISELSDKNWKV